LTDRRTTPDPSVVDGATPAQVSVPVLDLSTQPNGPRDRQLILGDTITVLGARDELSYVRSDKDGYVGYVARRGICSRTEPTHRISAIATHVYEDPDFKSPDRMSLSYGSVVTVIGGAGKFIETAHGYIPAQHVAELGFHGSDPVAVASLFLGTPYLWGGNSSFGIDCSGLIQAALIACGTECPGDSDQQMQAFYRYIVTDGSLRRGDLLFWRGHVALASGRNALIHANAHHMAVTIEDAGAAIKRIAEQGDGPLLAHLRPVLPA